ncbi:MAG: gliding motility-associated C-terminal domain-containing protein [Saprospiraceae bacterium]|nr:gliding motility-associated C-terminal domain-containing protein [Saprospiraceae bacterium]
MRFLPFLIFLPSFLFAQSVYQHLFRLADKEIEVASAISTIANGLVLGGKLTDEFNGNVSGFVARLNGTGALVWVRELGASNASVRDAFPAPDGGMLVVLSSQDNGDQATLVRLDAAGQVLWSRRCNEAKSSVFRLNRLQNGNWLIIGTGPAGTPGDSSGMLMSVDDNGQVVWTKVYDSTDGPMQFYDACEDDQGFLYVVGIQYATMESSEAILCRVLPSGTLDWIRRQESIPGNRLFRIMPWNGEQELLVGGYTVATNGFASVWLSAFRLDGERVWANSYATLGKQLFLYDLVPAPGGAWFSYAEQASNPQPGTGIGRINTNGDLLKVSAYDAVGKQGGAPRLALSAQNTIMVADGVVDGQGRALYAVSADSDGNTPPCCFLGEAMVVNDLSGTTEFPPGVTLPGPGLAGITTNLLVPVFEPLTDLCPDLNTDFSLSDTLICPGECITLTLTNPTPGAVYTWLTPGGTADPQDPNRICYAGDGNFSIVSQVNGCAQNLAAKTIMVNASGNDDVPTAFTPDGDGTNDVFRPLIICPITEYRFEIFNRWGQKVFETTNPDDAWDGRSNGDTPAVSDVYVWKLSYRPGTGEASERKGQVTVVR